MGMMEAVLATCVGCDEVVRLDDQAAHQQLWPGGCTCKEHPLHAWCAGRFPIGPCYSRCGDCDQPFERAAIMAICRWAAARFASLHDGSRAGPRPPGIWCMQHPWQPMLMLAAGDPPGWVASLSIIERGTVHSLPNGYRLFHDCCPGEDDAWLARLRAAPRDLELKLVYADALEQDGHVERAGYLRELVAERRGEPVAEVAPVERASSRPLPRWFRRLVSSR